MSMSDEDPNPPLAGSSASTAPAYTAPTSSGTNNTATATASLAGPPPRPPLLLPQTSANSAPPSIHLMRSTFDLLDIDGSGSIDAKQMKDGIKGLGFEATRHELCKFLSDYDLNGDGTINFGDWLAMLKHLQVGSESDASSLLKAIFTVVFGAPAGAPAIMPAVPDRPIVSKDVMKKAFMMLDWDGDGTIDLKELIRAMNSIGFKPSLINVAKFFNKHDTDGSGDIDILEWCSMLKKIQVDHILEAPGLVNAFLKVAFMDGSIEDPN